MALSEQIDQLCNSVKESIPDADFIEVGRLRIHVFGKSSYEWRIRFSLPRRGKKYQILRGSESISADGESFPKALSRAINYANYHRTGKMPE